MIVDDLDTILFHICGLIQAVATLRGINLEDYKN